MAFVGALIGAVGTIVQAGAASAAASYQAQVAKNNEIIAGYNADYARAQGAREEAAYAMKAGMGIAAAKAQFATSGIDVASPSTVRVLGGAAGIAKLDELTIRNNAMRQAFNFEVEGMNQAAQAELYGMQADSAMLGGLLGAAGQIAGAAGSLLGGGSVSSKWGSWSQPAAAASPPLIYSGPSASDLPTPQVPGLSAAYPYKSSRTPWPGGSSGGPSYFN